MLITVQFVVNLATFMSLPLLTVYMTDTLALAPTVVGTVLTANLLSARVLPVISGAWAERYGHRRLLVLGLVVRASGFLGVVVCPGTVPLIVSAGLIGLGGAVYETACWGVLAREPATIRDRVFILNNQVLNAGAVAGPALGMAAMVGGPEIPFLVSALAFMALCVVVARTAGIANVPDSKAGLTNLKIALRSANFRWLLMALVPFWFLYTQLYVYLPLHFLKIVGEARDVNALYILNAIIGIGFAFIAMRWMRGRSPRHLLVIGHLGLAGAFAVNTMGSMPVVFLLSVIVFTVAEGILLPASDMAIAEIAEPGLESSFFGISNLSWGLGGALGNYAGAWLASTAPSEAGWVLFVAVALAGAAACHALGECAEVTHSPDGEHP